MRWTSSRRRRHRALKRFDPKPQSTTFRDFAIGARIENLEELRKIGGRKVSTRQKTTADVQPTPWPDLLGGPDGRGRAAGPQNGRKIKSC
jgi:hypothetical protein